MVSLLSHALDIPLFLHSALLSFSKQLPIVYKEAQERIKRRRRGTNYSLTCLLHLCLKRTLKYKSPDVLAFIVVPLTSYHIVPFGLSSYPSLHRSSSHRFTPLFLTATPPFLHRYPAFRTIHRVVYASMTVQERVPERVPVNYNTTPHRYSLRTCSRYSRSSAVVLKGLWSLVA